MGIITFWAGYLQIQDIYIPNGQFPLASLAAIAMFQITIVFVGTFVRWAKLIKIKSLEKDLNGEEGKELVDR